MKSQTTQYKSFNSEVKEREVEKVHLETAKRSRKRKTRKTAVSLSRKSQRSDITKV